MEMRPERCINGKLSGAFRDTADLHLVTEMLMATLASLGEAVMVKQLRKRTKDDVLWNKSMNPWRRLSLWITMRVAIQTTLLASLPAAQSTLEYKNFMILFLSETASKAFTLNLSQELCHIIIAKIARRAAKLGSDLSPPVQAKAMKVCQTIKSKQDTQWQLIQKEDGDRPTTIEKRSFRHDTYLTLETSKQHLDSITEPKYNDPQTVHAFIPHCQTWLGWTNGNNGLPIIAGVEDMERHEAIFALAEFESWVGHSLPAWRTCYLDKPGSKTSFGNNCMALAKLATTYRDIALPIYQGNSEPTSIVFIIIAELWYSLDTLTVNAIPLLRDFSPIIPPSLFEPLLLPKKAQMQRLREVELHIENRQLESKRPNPSILADPVEDSFAVQYLNISNRHKTLRKSIEDDAAAARDTLREEWMTSSEKYRRLKNKARLMSCHNAESHHDEYSCKKCRMNREADSMTINVHEWPLPSSKPVRASVLLEPDCPPEFAAWRNITWMLLQDLGREGKGPKGYPAINLPSYLGLQNYLTDHGSRLTLASKTKAHHRQLKFPVEPVDLCFVDHGLTYHVFDPKESYWIQEQREPPSLRSKCVSPLPSGPYSVLQYSVDSVHHSQNQVIADQETCPKELSLHEFMSFGSLRADGERVQWHNIKRELCASNLTLNTEAVCTLITQAAYQAGSRAESVSRNSHLDLEDSGFCSELLASVWRVLDSIRANWKCDYTVLVLVRIVCRTLSHCTSSDVVDNALNLLHNIQAVIYEWTAVLSSALHKAIDAAQISRLQQRLFRTAVLCKLAFDVDEPYLTRVLSKTRDLQIWIGCSLIVRENMPGSDTLLPPSLQRLLLQALKLTHGFQKLIRDMIIDTNGAGLDLAVRSSWSSYCRGNGTWTILDTPNDRWLRAETAVIGGRPSQEVLFNILAGELLVNGRPLGNLPMEYARSDLYTRTIGAHILHCFSSDMPGMLYRSAQEVEGYHLHFGTREGEIIIRAERGSQLLEVVPHLKFNNDLPSAFLHNYVHWFDLSTQEIEFRPLDQRWKCSRDHWWLQYRPKANSTLRCGERHLVDIRSDTFASVFAVFTALEAPENIRVTLSDNDKLEIALPRYDIPFFLNDAGQLECYELCKIVDPNQSIGTLVGLRNRLVLCGTMPLSRKHDRILIIPDGDVSIVSEDSHVNINITSDSPNIRLFRYQIDATLSRLQGGGDTLSTLYVAYLHAITSHTMPDPFTQRTGTEEALSYLRQRAVNFIRPPEPKALSLLKAISDLTPRRNYSSAQNHVMQCVAWHSELSMLAQHDDFLPLAKRIASFGDPYIVFYPGTEMAPNFSKGKDKNLLARAQIRNACHRNSESHDGIDGRDYDTSYRGRDRYESLERGQRSFEIASLVSSWPEKSDVSKSLLRDLAAFGTLSGMGTKFEPSIPLSELLEMSYESSWGPLLGLCRASTRESHTYSLLFLFSSIAYSRSVTSLTTLRTLLAFAFVLSLQKLSMPLEYTFFRLSAGSTIDEKALRTTIRSHMKAVSNTGRRKDKIAWQLAAEKYRKECNEQTETVMGEYMIQWPTAHPKTPSSTLSPHLDWEDASEAISDLFLLWTANRKYEKCLKKVQVVLGRVFRSSHASEYLPNTWHLREKALESTYLPDPVPSLRSLMNRDGPRPMPSPEALKLERPKKPTRRNNGLYSLVTEMSPSTANDQSAIRSQSRDDLVASLEACNAYQEPFNPSKLPCSFNEALLDRISCDCHLGEVLESIRDIIDSKVDAISRLLEIGGLWPRITLRSLLTLLRTTSSENLDETWKLCLLALGKTVTLVQRARRLVLAGEQNDISAFCFEVENLGHQGWDAHEWPDWLLIEIEGDFLIRETQARVALEMIRPSSSANSLVQLNMGT